MSHHKGKRCGKKPSKKGRKAVESSFGNLRQEDSSQSDATHPSSFTMESSIDRVKKTRNQSLIALRREELRHIAKKKRSIK